MVKFMVDLFYFFRKPSGVVQQGLSDIGRGLGRSALKRAASTAAPGHSPESKKKRDSLLDETEVNLLI